MNLNQAIELNCAKEWSELMEGGPIRIPKIHGYIKQEGTQFCVHSHQTNKNFGCYGSRGEAESRLAQIKRFK